MKNDGKKNRKKSTSNSSDNYDKKQMKTRFDSDDAEPVNRKLKLHNIIILF